MSDPTAWKLARVIPHSVDTPNSTRARQTGLKKQMVLLQAGAPAQAQAQAQAPAAGYGYGYGYGLGPGLGWGLGWGSGSY